MNRRWRYFEDSDNYFQLALYLSTVIFIFGFSDECWCSTPWQWQIGAFAVFLSWLNFIFILRYLPYTAVPINMFLSICVTFLKLIFLPIVLILAFGMPHYMVFVRTTSSSEVSCRCNHWTCCISIISLVIVHLTRNKAYAPDKLNIWAKWPLSTFGRKLCAKGLEGNGEFFGAYIDNGIK